jgi:hypothetical protein
MDEVTLAAAEQQEGPDYLLGDGASQMGPKQPMLA